MRLLILGGTGFIGRHLTSLALAAGHEVTLFNRGKSGVGLFPEVETLVGDREGDLAALRGRRWDAAFDVASYFPRVTRLSGEVLRDSVGHYTLISTMALYADYSAPGLHEESPVVRLAVPTTEEVNARSYGGLKALCEEVVHEFFPGRALILRPGIIIGAYDTTDRFTYWVSRIGEGGNVLTPDCWDQPIQYIDARDLMGFGLKMATAGHTGTFNCTGPESTMPFGYLFEECARMVGTSVSFEKVATDFLLDRLETPGNSLPFWLPNPHRLGFQQIDSSKGQAAGLQYRPLSDSIENTLAWVKTLPADHSWQAGITRARERELLEEWMRHPTRMQDPR